ncbi:glycosyltransferase family 4 protein [Thalassomonas viridans]|uniref:Glycosyltransferase family 4 protein n=1 Tax=Thalassomonas viridans TaxID=137584 RepID=A0AAF0CD96_9GAMM|nr:glycosyltransferase family 4 protein [Thalassomonas viridans]WDE07904.1 glycosyltransferase family 4 protein [Thalassomonas viridans]
MPLPEQSNQQVLIMVNYGYQAELESPQQLLQHYFMLGSWLASCQKLGAKVFLFQRFHSDHQLESGGIKYFFIQDDLPPRPRPYHICRRFHLGIKQTLAATAINTRQEASAVCVHLHSLLFPLCSRHLQKILGQNIKWVVQHHAEQPNSTWLKIFSPWVNKYVDAFLFSNKTLALDWIKTKAVKAKQVFEVMECSSNCRPLEQATARKVLQLQGFPLLLWTANLDKNKDPLTILTAFAAFKRLYPQSRLTMLFRNNPLLAEVKEKIAADDTLTQGVSLLGQIDYQDISAYYSAADIFVQGSQHEGSGIAVLDALACGAIPVVTDIPSFNTLTGNGSVGALWPCGDDRALLQALVKMMTKNLPQERAACMAFFQRHWSQDKIAAKAMEVYFDAG